MFWIKEMGKYAGSMSTRALSGAETIHVNGEVLEYLIQGNQHGYCVVHTPQCRTYGTMPYAVCRMKYAVREHASSLLSTFNTHLFLNEFSHLIVRVFEFWFLPKDIKSFNYIQLEMQWMWCITINSIKAKIINNYSSFNDKNYQVSGNFDH